MSRVSKHSGTRAARPPAGVPRKQLLLLAAGITATLVVWGVLVFAAIEFGKQGRAGEAQGWIFLTLATVGAAGCLFLTLILGSKAVEVLAERRTAPGGSAPGGSAPGGAAPGGSAPGGAAPGGSAPGGAAPVRVPGGRRAAR